MADEKIYTNIGAVTAYAYAKEMGGYEGSPQQFATDQANFAKNAQQVREDKESVEATVETFDNTTVPAAVQTVTAEGTRQVGIVGTAGDTQVGVVQTEGTTQKNAVIAKGQEVIASIPEDYSELTSDVEDLKSSIDTAQDDIQRLDKSWQSDKNYYGLFVQYPMPNVRFASLGVNVFSDGKRFFTDYNPTAHKVSGGAVFYYSPDGNNSNDGSREHPKKTITRPYNNLSTHIFMDGVYDRNAIPEINKNVNIVAENPGKVIINHADYYEYTLSDGLYSTSRTNVSGVTIKMGEYFRPLTPVYNLADCKSTPFSFFSDTAVVYINAARAIVPDNSNTFLNLSGGSPLVSVKSDVDNINVYIEGITFIGGYAGGVVVQNTAAYKPTVHFNKCKFIGAYTLTSVARDALSVLGGDAYLYKCEAAFARKDGFNYHSLNNVAPKAIEIDCIGHDNGFGWNDSNCNGSTAHDGACVIRINGVYYNNKGANIADVMEDTISLNLACLAFNSKSEDTGNSSDYAAQQPGTEMWLDECKGYGSDWTIYALTGTTVHLHSVEKETTQGGGTIDDTWNPYT